MVVKAGWIVIDHQQENIVFVIKQQIYMYKTSLYTLVNGDMQWLTHRKQQKS